jgi:hypothetical protein
MISKASARSVGWPETHDWQCIQYCTAARSLRAVLESYSLDWLPGEDVGVNLVVDQDQHTRPLVR